MVQAELISAVARDIMKTKSEVTAVLASLVKNITAALVNGEDIKVLNLGTIKHKIATARTGRNPSNGESIEIPEKKRATLKCSKILLDAMNKG